jgi:DNA invertase Pin-like site-specific DNA recombinase
MTKGGQPVWRCAVYTRKSSEEGLEQDFNSLHAQREACEALIKSQKSEGWRLVETAYDDGGLSGGTMERPALQRLLDDIRNGQVDTVVVYKVDRLTRSLADFAKMVELFDAHDVSFVAVTQQFNTTTSMGRLTLNILLSFAQFEREVTGERIRDKIAASKRKGMWMGGNMPLGYDAQERKLAINQAEAETVREIYRRYLELGCVRRLKEDLDRRGIRSKARLAANGARSGGRPFSRGALYAMLSNPIYIGEIRHKGVRHLGQHQAIVDRDLWEPVQQRLRSNKSNQTERHRKSARSLLIGKLFDETGERLTPSHAAKKGRRYRYYVSQNLVTKTADATDQGWRLPAQEIERTVALAARRMLDDRAAIAAALQEEGVPTGQIPSALDTATEMCTRITSDTEIAETLAELVDRVELQQGGIRLTLLLSALIPKDSKQQTAAYPAITRTIPMQMKKRGVETRLVLDGNRVTSSKVDPALIKAIARAHGWFDDLVSGRAASIVEMAARDGFVSQYVGRLLPLAFLAPEIVEAIIEGRQPVDLTAETLTNCVDLPLDWTAQKRVLGFI